MIICDTNILSGLVKGDPIVEQWLNQYDRQKVWLNSITIMEIYYGIYLLPEGRKKRELRKIVDITIKKDFPERIMEFKADAALKTAELMASLKKTGYNGDIRDLQIAGIALATGAHLATRNIKDFQQTGIPLINPWNEAA